MAEMRAELVGLLIEKHGERAKIKLDKDKSKGEKIPKYLEAWCPINAKVGDVVGVEYQEMNKRKMQMILYGFPVLSVIAGAVFGNSIAVFFDIDKTMPVMLGVVIWLLVSVNYARIFKRDAVREGVQPVVIEIEAPDPIVFDDTEDENEKKVIEYNDTGWRYPTQVWKFQRDCLTSNLHPTQKPLLLCETLVKTFSNEGDIVLDNCMGSGTVGVACKLLNRKFIGIELEENYFKIAKERIDHN